MRIFLLVGCLLFLSACHDDEPAMPSDVVYDIMTLESRTDTRIDMSCQRTQGSPTLHFRADITPELSDNIAKAIPIGGRLLVAYTCTTTDATTQASPAPITIYGIGLVIQSDIKNTSSVPEPGHTVEALSVWRTGQWINMRAGLLYRQRPAQAQMYILAPADDSTNNSAPSPTPGGSTKGAELSSSPGTRHLYFTYRPDTDSAATINTRYCSFRLPDGVSPADTLIIHIPNTRQPHQFTIQP